MRTTAEATTCCRFVALAVTVCFASIAHRLPRLQLYSKFISNVEAKLNQLQFIQIVTAISAQYYPSRPYQIAEIERAESHLSTFLDKKARFGPAAYLVLQMEILSLKIKRAAVLSINASTAATGATLLDECKKEMVAGKDSVDAMPDGTPPIVTATVHRVAAEFYKLRGPAHLFYESALSFLGHTSVDSLSSPVRAGLAFDLATSALVGEGIYAFGEVNAHPILEALQGTEHAWLIDLLRAFQTGDIDSFTALSSKHSGAINAVPALTGHAQAVKEKITLLKLMEMAAARPAHGRSLSFAEISAACRVPADSVEPLAMRSLSLGLLKGSLDQVEQVRTHVTQQGILFAGAHA